MAVNQRIVTRIPRLVIHAVDDATQHIAAVSQNALQTAPQRRALDFLGVLRADRVDRIRKDDARLEQVQVAVELHLVPVEVLPVESRQQHVPVPETALVGQVVEREQGGNAIVEGNVSVFDLQVGGDQPGLPVVAVEHVNGDPDRTERLHHRAAEEGEPFAVVLIVVAVFAIQLRPVKVVVLLDQVDRNLRVGQAAAQQPALQPLSIRRQPIPRCPSAQSAGRSDASGDRRARTRPGWCPSFSSSRGKASTTSANPPVLANGTTSLLTNAIFNGPCSGSEERFDALMVL